MDETPLGTMSMDERLEQLMAEACQHPPGTRLWRKAMHRLLRELQQLPGLRKSSHPDYLQALNQTFEWIARNICRDFDRSRANSLEESLVKWINGYLYWRIKDLSLPETVPPISLDTPINTEEVTTLLEQLSETNLKPSRLSGLEGYIEQLQQQKTLHLGLGMERYIQQDPQQKLRKCYPRAYPNCHCQLLSERRYLKDPPDTFQDIAQELNVPPRQLTNHWYGRCKPLLQEIAKDLGYQPNEKL